MRITSSMKLATLAVAMLPLAACGGAGAGGGDSKDAKGPVTVGSLLPYSGEAAFLGENVGGKGATLAVAVANDNGGVLGQDVKLVSQDDQRRAGPAVSGLRALQAEHVTVGIGPTSATIPAVLPMLKKSDVPWVPIGSTGVLDTGLEKTHVWRTFASDSQQIPAMLLAGAKSGGKVGLVFENNASGQQQMAAAKKFASAVPGVQVTKELLLAPGQASYRSEAAQFLGADLDAVLWQLTDATAAGFFKSGDQTGKLAGKYFVGTDAALSDSLLKILHPYLAKATFAAVTPAESGPGRAKFAELYKKQFSADPVVLADAGYDATTLLLLAVERAKTTDPDAIAKALPAVASAPGTACTWFGECAELIRAGKDVDFQGAMNTLSFNETHNVVSDFALVKIAADGSTSGEQDTAFSVDDLNTVLDKAGQ
jgi:branched-chain amino acid transport system substrate-binding protein